MGPHAGFRRAHAKGICVAGAFTPSAEGLSKAAVFRQEAMLVIGRLAEASPAPFQICPGENAGNGRVNAFVESYERPNPLSRLTSWRSLKEVMTLAANLLETFELQHARRLDWAPDAESDLELPVEGSTHANSRGKAFQPSCCRLDNSFSSPRRQPSHCMFKLQKRVWLEGSG